MLETVLSSPYFVWPATILLACIIFSLAVFIHELGHFVAARLLGLRADVFSIGFGPALWKRKIGATELRLSAIPFGGYVSLPQLDPDAMKNIQGDHGETLPPASPLKRIIVAVAGPLGNVFLATICAAMIAWFSPEGATGASTEVGYVELNSSGWEAGLRRGDKILTVNDEAVSSWSNFLTECFLSGGTNDLVRLTYQRGETTHTTEARLDKRISETEEMYCISGLRAGPLNLGVGEIIPNSPAERAGLQMGDIITAINHIPLVVLEQIADMNGPSPFNREENQPFILDVRREKETFTVELMPEVIPGTTDKPKLGIVFAYMGRSTFPWMVERGLYAQLKGDVMNVVRVLRALTAPKNTGERGRAAKGLGGPLMIFGVLVQVIQMGLWVSLGFLRLICMNLAILNLLPLPVLDGGHILFATGALICRREPNAKVVYWVTMVFTILLLAAMVWFLFADVRRMVLQHL